MIKGSRDIHWHTASEQSTNKLICKLSQDRSAKKLEEGPRIPNIKVNRLKVSPQMISDVALGPMPSSG